MPKIESIEENEIEKILGEKLFQEWAKVYSLIKEHYELKEEWHTANKGQSYELKLKGGGKTLVSLFPRFPEEEGIGIMIIFGKDERAKFETIRPTLQAYTKRTYDDAKTYGDGKWVTFIAPCEELIQDLLDMLAIKRRPKK